MHRYQLFCLTIKKYTLDEYIQVTKHQLLHDGGPCYIETTPLIFALQINRLVSI